MRILNIQIYNGQRANLSTSFLKQLEHDRRLRTALVELSGDNFRNDGDEPDPKNIALARAMIEAPNLHALTIRLPPTCLTASPGQSTQGNWLQPSDNSFDQAQWIQSRKNTPQSLRALKIIGPNLWFLGSVYDFRQGILSTIPCSHLRRLELWNCGNCTRIFNSLTETGSSSQIRVFKIRDDPADDGSHWLAQIEGIRACGTFVAGLNNIEELALEGFGGFRMAFLTMHHRTLRKLTWICPQRTSRRDLVGKVNALQQIRDGCPHISSLTFNVENLHASCVNDHFLYCMCPG